MLSKKGHLQLETWTHPLDHETWNRYIRWINNNQHCTILNVDVSCNGAPIRTGFGGILRTHAGSYISAFSGRLQHSDDILLAELSTLYQGLVLTVNLNYNELACYSDSLLTVNLIKDELNHYHVYVVLIQNIKDIISSRNYSLHHSLREGNQCADIVAKLGASNVVDLFIHSHPPEGLLPFWGVSFFFFCCFCCFLFFCFSC